MRSTPSRTSSDRSSASSLSASSWIASRASDIAFSFIGFLRRSPVQGPALHPPMLRRRDTDDVVFGQIVPVVAPLPLPEHAAEQSQQRRMAIEVLDFQITKATAVVRTEVLRVEHLLAFAVAVKTAEADAPRFDSRLVFQPLIGVLQ